MNESNLEEQKNQPEVNDEPVENNELDIEISDLPDEPDKKRKGVLVGSTALILMVIIISVVVTIMMSRSDTNSGGESGGSDDDNTSIIDIDEDTVVGIDKLSSGGTETMIGGKKVAYNAKYIVDGVTAVVKAGTYESTDDDEVVFLVINGGVLSLEEGVVINKTGSTDFDGRGDAYSFYGTNSAVVVAGEGSQVGMAGVTINTSVDGANAVVATDGGSVVFANTTINTEKDASRGLHATFGGKIVGNDGTIATKGQSCAALATDRGEGTVKVSRMKLSTAGAGSPLVYSTGEIEVSSSTGTATGAQIAVVEGKNSITLNDCEFSTNGVGNRNNVDNAAVMIYQSMSGDASEGMGSFSANNSKFIVLPDSEVYETTPFFFVTNTTASITLDKVEASFYEEGYFVLAAGTEEWGKTGSNGGVVTIDAVNLTATNTNLGVDDISKVTGL